MPGWGAVVATEPTLATGRAPLDYPRVIDSTTRAMEHCDITVGANHDPTKLAGASGVLGFALATVGSAVVSPLWQFPGTGSTAAEITGFVVAHRTALLAAMILTTAGVSLWLVFGAGVSLRLRQATGADSLLWACFAFGLVGFVTLILAGFVPFFVLTYRASEVSDARLLYDLAFGLLAMSGVPTALALGSYAALVFRAGRLPRWTAWLAALAAAAHVALLASFVVTDGFFSLEGQVITVIPATLFVWIVGTSVAMLSTEP
jgi:hypothetical protein